MSDQMVPPPPPPPSSSPSGGGFDANAAVDQFKGADPLDLAVVGAGVLALILSWFSSYFTVSVSFAGYGGGSNGVSAWHTFFSIVGVLLLLIASGVTAARIVKVAVPSGEIIGAGAAVAGLLCVFLSLFIYPGGWKSETGVSIGHGWTYWAILILALVSGGITSLKFAKTRGLVK